MLGYNFTFESKVVSGDMRGRTIGFPTLNQHLPNGLVVPKYGVYESRTFVCGKEYKSFTNIGIRPTCVFHLLFPKLTFSTFQVIYIMKIYALSLSDI